MRALTVSIGTGLLVAILCVCGAAQAAPAINGPSLGFVADKEGATIWPLLGILDASVPGPPLVLPQDIRNAVISPRHDYALAIAGTNAQVFSPLKGTSVFRLGLSTGPLTVFDAHPGLPPRKLIIPVDSSKFSKEAQGER